MATGSGESGRARERVAEHRPVARVYVDVPLPHLDRLFDYLVPAELNDRVGDGSKVRVRFAGRLVDAYVMERVDATELGRSLSRIERVVGAEPVLTPATARLFRTVADRWAGSFVDVARLGVPPRHARVEAQPPPAVATSAVLAPERAGWGRYRAGASFVSAVEAGRVARAVWTALPGEDWPTRLAETMQAASAGGRGAIAVVPDARDVARVDAALRLALGPNQHVALTADLGPVERYRRWLAVRRGHIRVVVGTRASAFAPVADLGLVAVWDDGDDIHAEPRAPYPDVRGVLTLRSSQEQVALLVGGFARTAESQQLVESGWAHQVVAGRGDIRTHAPRVTVAGSDVEQERDAAAAAARLPSIAFRTAKIALAAGEPVLVQVPRAGYAPALACARDRTPARCAACGGPLGQPAGAAQPACRWCGRPAANWSCPVCGARRLRAQVTGSTRTAEELGRAFPAVLVRTSDATSIVETVPAKPILVVATPGAEPLAEEGYGAALLLDAWALLGRADLRAGEEAIRRWMNAATLVRAGGEVILAGADPGVPAVQALVRWDPAGAAARELAERAELGFPPAVRMAALRGSGSAIGELLAVAELPASTQRIGPVNVGAQEQVLLRTPRADGAALAAALHAAAAIRSGRKSADPVRVQLNPAELG